jgi:hypothetical protein
MWKVEEGGALRTWQPGAKNTIPGIDNMDSTLKELLEGVAQAGSWALWMGVFTRGWMDLLAAGGMGYHRARSRVALLGSLVKCQVISESRSAIAKERNESEEQEGRKKRRKNERN